MKKQMQLLAIFIHNFVLAFAVIFALFCLYNLQIVEWRQPVIYWVSIVCALLMPVDIWENIIFTEGEI